MNGAMAAVTGMGPWYRRSVAALRAALVATAVVVLGISIALAIADRLLGPPPLDAATPGSVVVLDREDRLLRAFTTPEGRWRLPVTAADVHPRYLEMLLAYEDRRFYQHRGVDPVAFLRSLRQLLTTGRVVSGGSTLTMQVARLLEGRHDRTLAGKLRQIVRAVQLEQRLSKAEILDLYLRLAPFGGNLEGVRAASIAYFGKEPMRLSAGEAALLVALPQAPSSRRPDVDPRAARIGRARVLATAEATGIVGAAERARADAEPVVALRKAFPLLAAHLTEAVVAANAVAPVHRLTIDLDAQSALEGLARDAATAQGPKISTAIIAIDHASGEVLAQVGSAGYLDDSRFGSLDMVSAIRSPGSTLKPLLYGIAFEQGLAHPETLIEDRPSRFGLYQPKNFDEEFHGTVSIREALQLSLNVPAVKVLSAIGPMRLSARVKDAGATLVLPPRTVPSLALALGGVGMRLTDLATLYAAIARGGEAIELHWLRPAGDRPASRNVPARLLSPVAAWYVADILRGTPPPHNAARGRIAYKTGTSYGYRDAWAAGFDGKHTIVVWIGRPDGVPTPGLTGLSAAAPLLFEAFARLSNHRTPLRSPPDGVVIAKGSGLPPTLRLFKTDEREKSDTAYAEPPLAIAFPPNETELELTIGDDGKSLPIMLKAEGGALPLTWLVNGAPLVTSPHKREAYYVPDGRGFMKLSVIDARGRVDRVTVNLR
jgi:penicillin-binding protein 1C